MIDMHKIQILGTGCAKCDSLTKATVAVADELGMQYELEKVTDLMRFVDFGVMVTPALVVDGKVVEVICYPPRSAGQDIGEVGENKDGTVTVPQNAGHTVITFKPETNGTATDGDLTIDGEGVALIGNGVDKTIIGGNLKIASNKSVIRGLTVQGNVTFEKNSNNASISFCKVYGNLEVHSNDTSVIACQVFGNVEVKGNNDTVVYTGVGNNFKVDGKLAVCAGNYGFDDKNDDHIVDVAEETGEIACK